MGHPECKHTSGTYETIARCEGENWKANARFIVTACNNYNDLLEALERIERVEDDYSDNGHGAARLLIKKIARAAIDKAKGA